MGESYINREDKGFQSLSCTFRYAASWYLLNIL